MLQGRVPHQLRLGRHKSRHWQSEEEKDEQWEERRECRTEVKVVATHPPSSAETVGKYAVLGLGCTAAEDTAHLLHRLTYEAHAIVS